MKWDTWTRGTIHPHRADIIMRGLAFCALPDFITLRALYVNNRGNLWWSWHHQDLANLGNKLKKELSSAKTASRHFRIFDKYTKRAAGESARIIGRDLKSLNDQNLAALYDRLFAAAYPANIILAADIDAFDTLLEDFIGAKIRQELVRHLPAGDVEPAYQILSATIHQTYVSKQELAVMALALRKNISSAAVKKLWRQFWWTNLGWENMRPHTLAYFKSLVNRYHRRPGLALERQKLVKARLDLKRRRSNLLKKIGRPPVLLHWLEIVDRYASYHDIRKELECRSLYAFHLLLLETARRRHLRPNNLEWLWHHEVKAILAGQPLDLAEIRRRRNWVAAIARPGRLSFYSGERAKQIKERELLVKKQRLAEFKGLGVTSGIVRGRIKICMGIVEARRKVKPSDILVTNMTTPDFVPIMKRVKAIITNEGGVTCHAAVIAREFHIPCIVGTKVAMQVLHDGDRVELDAAQGTVKIIK
ncbi:MAG: PEP-utilizing enzyme [Patescibacteria group bacterium]